MKKLLFVLIVGLMVLGRAMSSETGETISILLRDDYPKTHEIDVDGKKVSSPDALKYLDQQIRSKGRESTVFVLCHESLRFSDVGNIAGLITKVGFQNLRFFIYSVESGRMNEVSFSQELLPFSRHPQKSVPK